MSNEIVKRLNEIKLELKEEKLAEVGFKFFRQTTPIKTGNARRNTKLNKTVVEANYPYARRLDEGYSTQARDGMTKPTIEHVQEYVKKTSKG